MESVYPKSESPRVVEAVDGLGDTVVRVRQLEMPEGRGASSFYLPVALLLLLVTGGCFFSAVSTASVNVRALHHHVLGGEASHSFRAKNIPLLSS
ncbi:MAG: hypothetical protein GY811_07685 [Myxococcales bacterium]|nr:hypothetical protein [Myxococcales bacterium]